jgi:adenosylcobinamide-GDP ribazoletransferase
LAALQFLTIIPLPGRREVSPEELGRSAVYFPLIGLIIGLLLAGWHWLLGLFLPRAVVDVLVVVSLVVISGALHLDGFIDTFDGIAGHKSVEDRWRVMHDSRAGGFGIVAVCCLLLVKYLSLNSVPDPLLMVTLVMMPVLSRWAMTYAIFAYPYARPAGLGKAFKQGTRWLRFTIATVIAVIVAIILLQLAGVAVMLGIWIIVAAMATYLKGKFSGLTGDTYGAINEVAEVCVLIIILVLYRLFPYLVGMA